MGLLGNTKQQQYYNGTNHGDYQFTSLNDIINQFIIAYVGENKIISKAKRVDVAFHAQRALQELSFDTLKSIKAQEITVPATLQMTLPQDYVNYTKVSWVDGSGIKHVLYPTSKTSNPTNYTQDSNGNFRIEAVGTISGGSDTMYMDVKYSNILVGMTVSGVGIVPGTKVTAAIVSSNRTVLTLDTALDLTISLGSSAAVTNATYIFTNGDVDESLLQEPLTQVFTEVAQVTSGNAFIDFQTALSGISIGDLVSSEYFPVGTVITGITSDPSTTPDGDVGTRIYVSKASTNPGINPNLYNKVITFTSQTSQSDTWSNYKSSTPSEINSDDYEDDTYWPLDGQRYGIDPQHAQVNGSFYIDTISGKIYFSSNISGKTVILDYISDSLGTDDEMQVHKFAEEAMYKHIAYAMLSTSSLPIHQQLAPRFKKEKFAATRQAKLRLSNIKLEELTQILRGKSKQIKH